MTEHGYGPYTNGCRCEICRKAKADYMRARRAAARALAQKNTHTSDGLRGSPANTFTPGAERHVVDGVKHGTRYAYDERGCRCRDCTTKHDAWRNRRRAS